MINGDASFNLLENSFDDWTDVRLILSLVSIDFLKLIPKIFVLNT